MASPKSRADDIAESLSLFVSGHLDLEGPRTAAQVELEGMTVEDLHSIMYSSQGELPSAPFDGALVGVRYRDADGAWHTLVPLSDSPAEFEMAWFLGVNRMAEQYGRNIGVTDVEIYVVETE